MTCFLFWFWCFHLGNGQIELTDHIGNNVPLDQTLETIRFFSSIFISGPLSTSPFCSSQIFTAVHCCSLCPLPVFSLLDDLGSSQVVRFFKDLYFVTWTWLCGVFYTLPCSLFEGRPNSTLCLGRPPALLLEDRIGFGAGSALLGPFVSARRFWQVPEASWTLRFRFCTEPSRNLFWSRCV